ncbi:MAG: glutamate racemase [Bacteroidales bacterium]|nr:glutamate racemase [Bacteroidales bacterium]
MIRLTNITRTPVFPEAPGRIGVFDSGYGGLTILNGIRRHLPEYDYLYLGDNARAPYGSRSFDLVYRFTFEAVRTLFRHGCHLVILACNTASAKALRTIQQNDLPRMDAHRRVLGVIRPTVEEITCSPSTSHVGILATPGTVQSRSYSLEIEKLDPGINVTEVACPLWVPLIENNEAHSPGADYFVKKYIDILLDRDPEIDTIILGCTHYPILMDKIRQFTPEGIRIIAQGDLVGRSLADYLTRHPEMERLCSKGGSVEFLTTENEEKFNALAELFLHHPISSSHIEIL